MNDDLMRRDGEKRHRTVSELHGAAAQQIGEALTVQLAPDGATGEAMVPGDVDFRFGTHH